jgi:hypothetical protein
VPKSVLLTWEILNWLGLVATLVLCYGIVRIKPGAGPQGGEFYFCSLFVLAGWLVLAAGVNAGLLYGGASGLVRLAVFPTGGIVLGGAVVGVAFKLLNDASLVRPPDSHLGLALSGSALIVILALANALAPRIAAMLR